MQEVVGCRASAGVLSGATMRVSWVKGLFDHLPEGATPEVVTIYAWSFTWVLVGGVLLADQTGDHIPAYLMPLPDVAATFSWGSVVLAWLYQNLPKPYPQYPPQHQYKPHYQLPRHGHFGASSCSQQFGSSHHWRTSQLFGSGQFESPFYDHSRASSSS
ncbi:hypothetical protein LINPERHAP2_LOCUS29989 [Linum perenne]